MAPISIYNFVSHDILTDGPEEDLFDPDDRIDVGEPTNAGRRESGSWTILVGVDIRRAGCWKVTGEYRGQTLSFVVESVLYEDWKSVQE